MYLRSVASGYLRLLLPLSILLTTYLYLYPIFHGCAFPSTNGSTLAALRDTFHQHRWREKSAHANASSSLAPFRLLVLADPQLEGDSSLPKNGFTLRIRAHWNKIRSANKTWTATRDALQTVIMTDIPEALMAARKVVDLFGNDYYLAHIYRTMHWWSRPTHVTVLGDLIGSQWVTDSEFERRGRRYWKRVFARGQRVEDKFMNREEEDDRNISNIDDSGWETRVINIAGNHDIGYAGDITRHRVDRFEQLFGKVNWDIRFEYSKTSASMFQKPTLHMIILNNLNLDQPAFAETVQSESYEFINSVISKRSAPVEDRSSFTLLLTHVPLHKKAGICVDAPHFDFYDDDDGGGGAYRPLGIREQNHLSETVSWGAILSGIFGINGNPNAPAHGKGRRGVILNGHDHEGCDTWHYLSPVSKETASEPEETEKKSLAWDAVRWRNADLNEMHTGLREVTLRSMMGDFGGNAGLFSAWFNFEQGRWEYDIQMCSVGVQHMWWAIHVLDLITLASVVVWFLITSRPAWRLETPSNSPMGAGKSLKQE